MTMHVFQGFAKWDSGGPRFVLWCIFEITVDTFSREKETSETGMSLCVCVCMNHEVLPCAELLRVCCHFVLMPGKKLSKERYGEYI